MSAKEQVVELICSQGYDFCTACEEYHRIVSSLQPGEKRTFYVGNVSFTLARR